MKERRRLYAVDSYEEVYEIEREAYEDRREELIELLRDRQIAKYCVKTIKSGDMLEVEAYPLYTIPEGKRGERKNKSTLAQQRLNDKNTVKHVKRIVHANFTEKDMWATWTYSDDNLPADHEQAKRDMQNFIRRMKRWLKRNGHEDLDLKYVYVTEFDDGVGKKTRVHHHMITNFPDRDVAEELWNGGGRVQTRRLQPDDHGLEGLVRYILKDKKKRPTKRYSVSRNMKEPKVTVADSKMTRKRSERLVTEEICAQELFEKWYPGYSFNDMEAKLSEWSSGAYIYVRMKKIDSLVKHKRRNLYEEDEDDQHY